MGNAFYYSEMRPTIDEYYANISELYGKTGFWQAMSRNDDGARPSTTLFVFYFLLGLGSNIPVIYLSFFKLNNDFRLFFANLAIIDSLFALCGLLSYVGLYFFPACFANSQQRPFVHCLSCFHVRVFGGHDSQVSKTVLQNLSKYHFTVTYFFRQLCCEQVVILGSLRAVPNTKVFLLSVFRGLKERN